MALVKQILQCTSCDIGIDEEPLFTCIYDTCSKYGEIYCEGCGQTAHKRKNHQFDIRQSHIKPVDSNTIQNDSNIGLSAVRNINNAYEEQKYGGIRDCVGGASIGSIASWIVGESMNIKNLTKLSNATQKVISGGTKIGQQGLMLGAITDVAVEATKASAEGAGCASLVMATFEIILHTAKFMNGEYGDDWKEYGYHIFKGLSTTAGMGLGNWGGTTFGVTAGTIIGASMTIGGPIGGIIGGIIVGFIGGMAGAKVGRELFNFIWSDDFIQNKQNGREQMIRDSLKLYGFCDVKDIEDPEIFNARAIKKMYHILAKRYHPDKNLKGGTECEESIAKFHEINAALGVLLSLLKRNQEDKKIVVRRLKEIKAIKWKTDIQKLSKLLIDNQVMYIIDICNKWDERLTTEFMGTLKKVDLLEIIEKLNKDEKYKHEISVIDRNTFANVIEKWNGKIHEHVPVMQTIKMNENVVCNVTDITEEEEKERDQMDDHDDIEYDDMEELKAELRGKKVLDVAEICEKYDDELTLQTLLEYSRDDLKELIKEINDDDGNEYKISVINKNKFVKIVSVFAEKQCELCVSK